ncbi:MAG: aminopeptidase P family protein [Pyrinomonadaceae bacterium]|nr:aminopeptidase P family protein [Pyrinomonadaceae bacterium]
MKKSLILMIAMTILSLPGALFADDLAGKGAKKVIRVAPAAPRFTDAERQAELASRRAKVASAMADNSVLVLFSADSKLYANDVDYVFRQENNHYYLTSLKLNGSTLVMSKRNGNVSEALFLPKRNPRAETWNGRMYSNSDAQRLSGIKTIVDSRELKAFLDALKGKIVFKSKDGVFSSFVPESVYLLQGNRREYKKENEFAKSLTAGTVRNAIPIFANLRLVKSPYEIKLMQHAVDITNEAHMRSMGVLGRSSWEYEVQAEVEYTFRRRNADFWGYPSIVGCGPNATTLHYVEAQGKINKGDLMLMDVGAEYDHYTADITRTFPVSGKFTKQQAEIYQIVYDAQEAAAKEIKPGAKISDASRAAAKVIREGLFKLGLITDVNSNQHRIWYMHGWGHWIGMNVHDVGNYGVTLKEGMMMSNEPGIYFREDALEYLSDTPANREFIAKVRPVFEKYKNIGVRIEDDMLVTKDGVEWMSKDLPRSIRDVEDFMAKASKEMAQYAATKSKIDPVLAVYGSGRSSYGLVHQSGVFETLAVAQGKTLRAGWKNGAKTLNIHAH